MSNRVRDMELHLDNYSREDISAIFTTTRTKSSFVCS